MYGHPVCGLPPLPFGRKATVLLRQGIESNRVAIGTLRSLQGIFSPSVLDGKMVVSRKDGSQNRSAVARMLGMIDRLRGRYKKER
jgi:hypothetical protein